MLPQGQSSSAKRGGFAGDVSSGLIFLKKKKEKKKNCHSTTNYGPEATTFFFRSLGPLSVQSEA